MIALVVIAKTIMWVLAFMVFKSIFAGTAFKVIKALLATIVGIWAIQAFAASRLDHCVLAGLDWAKTVFLLKPACPIHLGNTEPFAAAGFSARYFGVLAVLIASAISASLSYKKQRIV